MLPMLLTWMRIALVPACVVVFYLPVPWARPAAAGIFLAASLTDWFDGWLARRLQQTTAFGAFLDPVADKLMVATALFLVVEATARSEPLAWSIAVAVASAVIVGRELTVSALREWMAALGASARVAVSQAGKVKTTVQMTALVVLLFHDGRAAGGADWLRPLGVGLLLVAAVLSLHSMARYLAAAWPVIRERGGNP